MSVRMFSKMKQLRQIALLCAGVGAMAFAAAAAPASAAEIYLQSDGLYNPGTITISGPSVNIDAYAGPLVFDANHGVGPSASTVELIGFCVDIFHDITAGINTQQALNLQYHTSTLATDGDGHALSALQIEEVGGLVDFGAHLFKIGDPDLSNKLAGVQGAIWTIMNPDYTIAGGSTAISDYIADYIANAPLKTGPIQVIYADNFATQGFAIAGVPEPGTWAMMIMGMLGAGAALRNGRRQKSQTAQAH